jgi:hypothetical protein
LAADGIMESVTTAASWLLNHGAESVECILVFPGSPASPPVLWIAFHPQFPIENSPTPFSTFLSSLPSLLSPPPQPLTNRPIPALDPHRHLELVERVLHDVIRVALIHALHDGVDVRHERVGYEQEFASRVGLETAEPEEGGFERFNASYGDVGVGGCEGGGGS